MLSNAKAVRKPGNAKLLCVSLGVSTLVLSSYARLMFKYTFIGFTYRNENYLNI